MCRWHVDEFSAKRTGITIGVLQCGTIHRISPLPPLALFIPTPSSSSHLSHRSTPLGDLYRPFRTHARSTSTMAPKDRTAEFHSTLSSIRSRTAIPSSLKGKQDESKQRLLGDSNGVSVSNGKGGGKDGGGGSGGQKSEFGRMASGIAKDINSTTVKLQKLAQRRSNLPLVCAYSVSDA